MERLLYFLEWINKWKLTNGNKLPACFTGLKISIASLIELWKELNENYKFKFLLTNRLNQDCIENFFAIIRQKGGCSQNPTPQQFHSAFKTRTFVYIIKATKLCKLYNDKDKLLTNLVKDQNNKSLYIKFSDESNKEEEETTALPDLKIEEFRPSAAIAEQQILFYISGFIVKKIMQKHSCESCKKQMVTDNAIMDSNIKLFTYFKAYTSTEKSDFGQLCIPSVYIFLY